MTHRWIVVALLVAHVALANAGDDQLPEDTRAQAPRPGRPTHGKLNILLLIGDDHGWPYFGFMGNQRVLTPNMDRLARGGTVFARGYAASSVCLPTLNAMLTGIYPYQWEHRLKQVKGANDFSGMEELTIGRELLRNYETLPRILSRSGYVSFQGGKLWNARYDEAGFTHGMSTLNQGEITHTYTAFDGVAGGRGLELARETMQPVYDFIDEHAGKPFFVWYAPMLPHYPHDAPAKYLDYYASMSISKSARKYYANCTRWDESVGRLIDYLQNKNLLQDTLIIYFSDNGWEQLPDAEYDGDPMASLLGGPHGKLSLHSLGFRTPFIFYLPGKVPAGVTKEQLVDQIDLFSTILDYADAKSVDGALGRSLRPKIEGNAHYARDHIIGSMRVIRVAPDRSTKTDESALVSRENAFHLTTSDWHYIWYETRGTDELYDTRVDPDELRNVATEHADRRRTFRQQIEKWRATVTEQMLDPALLGR